MGCDAEIIAVGANENDIDDAVELIHTLESRWSRFRPDSDIGRINTALGIDAVTQVHWSTRDVVSLAIEGCRRTHGRFDPTIYGAMVHQGYDRTYAHIGACVEIGMPLPSSGRASDVRIDQAACTIFTPAGVGLDLGGIAKGYAAELTVRHLRTLGAAGAMVNIGGDVFVSGDAPNDDVWIVSLLDPRSNDPFASVRLVDGAVTVSTSIIRRWNTTLGTRHHLIDPQTSNSLPDGNLQAVAVLAGSGWWAEVLTKALLVDASTDLDLGIDNYGADAHAFGLLSNSTIQTSRGAAAFLRKS